MSMNERLVSIARGTTPAGPVAVARMMVGAAAGLKAVYVGLSVLPRLGPETLRAPFFDALPPASVATIAPVLAIWAVAAVHFAAGLRTRLAGATLVAMMVLLVVFDQQFYSNHLYLLTLTTFLLTLADSGAVHSLDATRDGARPMIPKWPVTLLCTQLTIVYGYAAIAKLQPEFLSGMIVYESWVLSGLVPLPEAFRSWWMMMPLAVFACVGEFFLAFAFWYPRLRKAAVTTGIVLHVGIIPTMGDVVDLTIFAVLMFSVYALFVGYEPARWRAAGSAANAAGTESERVSVVSTEFLRPAAGS